MDLCLLTVKCIKQKNLIKLTIYLTTFEILKTVSYEWIVWTTVVTSLYISCIMLLIIMVIIVIIIIHFFFKLCLFTLYIYYLDFIRYLFLGYYLTLSNGDELHYWNYFFDSIILWLYWFKLHSRISIRIGLFIFCARFATMSKLRFGQYAI